MSERGRSGAGSTGDVKRRALIRGIGEISELRGQVEKLVREQTSVKKA